MTASASALSSGPRYAPADPTLPKPWKGLVDGSTGYLYYWNPETNVTQYERPVAELPPPPPLLTPSPHRHPKYASVAVSSTILQSLYQKQRERDSHDDDGHHGRSRSNHQHGGGRGSSSHNYRYGARGFTGFEDGICQRSWRIVL